MKKGEDEDGDFGVMYKNFDTEMEGRMWIAANELAGYYMGQGDLIKLKIKKHHGFSWTRRAGLRKIN